MLRWMGSVLRYFLRSQGRDQHGGLTILAGRDSDPSLCNVVGISPEVAGKALDIICDAFMIPESQKFSLRPDDVLMDIYRSLYDGALVDAMEFEFLMQGLEDACHRRITEDEEKCIRTVGDVIRFLGRPAASAPLEEPDAGRRKLEKIVGYRRKVVLCILAYLLAIPGVLIAPRISGTDLAESGALSTILTLWWTASLVIGAGSIVLAMAEVLLLAIQLDFGAGAAAAMILTPIPVVGLLVMMATVASANVHLRKAGATVGLLGVRISTSDK